MEDDIVEKKECLEIEIPFNLFQYLSTDNCNIQNLCRICLSDRNKELFPLISAADSNLLEMFTALTAIQVDPNDGLPSHICDLCKANINSYYEFKSQCVKSDCALKSLLKGEITTKDEPSIPAFETNIILKDANIPVTADEIKNEEDIEDVQYLEDYSDSEACTVQSNDKNQKEALEPPKKEILLKKDLSSKAKEKKQKSHVCSFCYKRLRSTSALQAHVRRAHGDGAGGAARPAFACAQCEQAFGSEQDLALHRPEHAPGPWACVQCGKGFKGRSMFRRHVQRHMSCKRYACEWCAKGFSELYALRRHARVHTGERALKPHACHLCGNKYAHSSLLSAHVARHGGARPFVCVACGNAFPSARLLRSHRRVHQEHKPHACTHCDKRFRHESTLRTHERTHTGERPYVCATCGKRFIQNSNLTLHMRTHTGDRPYSCETCGRSFSSGSTLKTHIRTHTGEKPYECPDCGKRFARMDLRAHRRLHSGERPFACAVCARRFPTRARAQEHARLHTGEKPFECAQCCQKFSSKSHLAKHIKTHQIKKKRISYQPQHLGSAKTIDVIDKIDVVEDVVNEEVMDTREVIVESMHDASVIEEVIIPNANSESQADTSTGAVYATEEAGGGAGVRLYQLDRSVVRVHSAPGHLTISRITSKMTANF